MAKVGPSIALVGVVSACASVADPDITRAEAEAICLDRAIEHGAPELDRPFGPDGLRADIGLPPYESYRARPKRVTVYQTCFHRLTGELPDEIPPLG